MTEKLLQFVLKYWYDINAYGKVTEDAENNQMYVVIPIDVLLETLDMSFSEFSNLQYHYKDD